MLWADIETFSEVPIRHGTAKYSANAELMLFAYALDDDPISIWDVTENPAMPADLKKHLDSDEPICGHYATFEASVLTPLFGIDPKRWRCSMAKCYAHALPGALENAGIVLGLDIDLQKFKDGKALIHKFCKPAAKNSKHTRNTRLTHPKEWERFKDYCKQDVAAMRAVWKRSPSWNYPNFELDFWHLDQKINRRGMAADLELAGAAVSIAGREKNRLANKTMELTEGQVKSATQRDAMLSYIADAYDIKLDNLRGSTIETFLEKMVDIPQELAELLATRLQSNRTSAAKYKRIFDWEHEGRLKHTLQYCGAARTLRFSGRGPQGQNLKRPEKYISEQWNFAAEVVKAEAVDLFFDDTMDVLASMVRGTVIAPPGKKLIVSDLAGIEGCVLPWLAGEETELKRYHDLFAGSGFDSYIWAYARSFGMKPALVTKAQRTIGKPISLSFGYQGGAGAFVSMAAIYGVDLDDMAKKARASLPDDIIKEAEGLWAWANKKFGSSNKITRGLTKDIFIVCDSLKRIWRQDHPMTVRFWDELEKNCKLAIENPDTVFSYRKLKFQRTGNWLRILLPSGTYLCYPSPRADEKGISYMGIKQFTKKWERIYTFGGKLAENTTSSTSRGVLKHGIIRAEDTSYEVVTHSHDEIVAEVPDTDEFTAEGLSELMTTGIDWAGGLPLAAAGFETYRYRKE